MTAASASIALVIPCRSERAGLRPAALPSLLEDPRIRLLFVIDGPSNADTRALEAFASEAPDRVSVAWAGERRGKGETVREGLRAALRSGACIVGYVDLDLAIPADELLRLARIMLDRPLEVLIGSRVRLAGWAVERGRLNHYFGRAFATAASLLLRASVYDVRGGAKFFRASAALEQALARPFVSRNEFDLELIGRLLAGSSHAAPVDLARMAEEPLQSWRELRPAPLRPGRALQTARDLVAIERDLRRRRAAR